jgi:Xaa-Pro aminopeptidase
VSSETQINGLMSELVHVLSMSSSGEIPVFDPVVTTAEDHPQNSSLPETVDPASDHLDPELANRRGEVDEKHRRIVAFLQAMRYDAVILTRADSIAWFTAGGDLAQDLGSEQGEVALFINAITRAVLTDNVQSARAFEEELAGLGFQLKERPWHQDASKIIADLAHNKKVATDGHYPGLIAEQDRLGSLRRPMTDRERTTLRSLGRGLSLAVEATCRSIHRGETEADVAGNLAHRLIREGIAPVEIRIAADDRLGRYRQPHFKASPIRDRVTIQVTGRRQGVCASMSRTVAFGPVDPRVLAEHTLASMVGATCIFFSRPGEPVKEVYRRAKRIFEKFEHAHEWTLDYQGAIIGYVPREILLLPDSTAKLTAKTALRWGPSVGTARSEDTIFIDDEGFDVITNSQDWPAIEVCVKGFTIPRPAILVRS